MTDDTGYAAPTTATDGRRVFAIFANGDLAAFDVAGKLAWAKSLGIPENTYGHASSLTTYKNLLLVQFDQGSAQIAEVEAAGVRFGHRQASSGKLLGRCPIRGRRRSSIRVGDRDQLIASGDPWVIAYNPGDGSEIWRVKCLQDRHRSIAGLCRRPRVRGERQ